MPLDLGGLPHLTTDVLLTLSDSRRADIFIRSEAVPFSLINSTQHFASQSAGFVFGGMWEGPAFGRRGDLRRGRP